MYPIDDDDDGEDVLVFDNIQQFKHQCVQVTNILFYNGCWADLSETPIHGGQVSLSSTLTQADILDFNISLSLPSLGCFVILLQVEQRQVDNLNYVNNLYAILDDFSKRVNDSQF